MRSAAFALALTAIGCTSSWAPPCSPGSALVNATLWMQSAAEYRAAALQTYAAARIALDRELAAPGDSSKPPAIILDLDETALDNSRYAARSIDRNTTFNFDANWNAWVAEASSTAIPGAKEFLVYASSRGVTPFYITNRGTDLEADTRRNLQSLGFPLGTTEDTLLVRGARPEWSYDKTPRRDFVASRYRVLLLLGDDLNDFTAAGGKSVAERNAILEQNRDAWGTRWFVVPNAIYGSWESAVTASGGTPCDALRR